MVGRDHEDEVESMIEIRVHFFQKYAKDLVSNLSNAYVSFWPKRAFLDFISFDSH